MGLLCALRSGPFSILGVVTQEERIAVGLVALDIQKALLIGAAPPGLDPEKLLSRDIPLDWEGQRRFLGFASAFQKRGLLVQLVSVRIQLTGVWRCGHRGSRKSLDLNSLFCRC